MVHRGATFFAQNAPEGRGENVAPRGAMKRSGKVAGTRLDLAIPQQGLGRSRCIIVRCVVVDPRAVWRFDWTNCQTQLAGAAEIRAVAAQNLAVEPRVTSLQSQSCGYLRGPFVGPCSLEGLPNTKMP